MMSVRFRETIKGHRLARGLSQLRAAERCDLDHTLIARLETGQRNPTRGNIAQLVVGYDLTPGQHDALLLMAGFSPDDPLAVLADEPIVLALYRTLRDEAVPGATREHLRAVVGAALTLAGR